MEECALGFDHHAEAALDALGADAGVSEALEAAQHQPHLLRTATTPATCTQNSYTTSHIYSELLHHQPHVLRTAKTPARSTQNDYNTHHVYSRAAATPATST